MTTPPAPQPQPQPQPTPRRRRLLPKLALAAVVTVLMGLGLELVIRVVDGYHALTWRLVPVAGRLDDGPDAAADMTRAFLAQPALQRADVDAAWFGRTPPPVPKLPLRPEMAAAFQAGFFDMFNYQWNELLLKAIWVPGTGPSIGQGLAHPDAFWVFTPIEPSLHPRYRFPQSVTLPSGVTLNEWGCRGRQMQVDKAKQTIRIACVGASTTVDDHQVAFSYPELLEGFLDAWAERNHPGLDFEVINAGCEGYSSTDIRETVRHYVLPLAVDYVVYYEGANQMQQPHVMQHLRLDGEVPPKPLLAGFLDAKAAVAAGQHQWLYQHSAAARRLQTVLVRGEPIGEPAKPKQHLELPAGLDEGTVDLARGKDVLLLGTILADLDQMHVDTKAAGVTLVLTSYHWFVHEGMLVTPVHGERIWRQLNDDYWPASYATMRRCADLENRWFAAWANARGVPFLDTAAVMPEDERAYTDAIHKTAIGSRCHAWAVFCLLLPQLERDLAAGKVPLPDTHPDARHPNIPPMRQKSYAAFDAEHGR
ncbi:MAG: hypothetical protein JNN13_19020 [Planctomycetes bacterium]|nr:hypothetical protein [Planctomycetota bacterium]